MVNNETMTDNQDAQPTDAAADAPEAPLEQADDLFTNATTVEDPVATIVVAPPTFGRPIVSPDGTRVAFFNPDAAGTTRLWIGALETGTFSPLELDIDLTVDPHGPRWSPDGSQLVIAAAHPADGRSAIWVVQIEQQFARLLVDHPGSDSGPVWSPDGAWIGFLSNRDGRTAAMVIPADGLGTPLQAGSAVRGFNDHSLTWARDSGRLAYAQNAVDGDKVGDHIYTFDLKSGTIKQVTTRLVGRRDLSWAPDRNLIMHIANDNEWELIAVVNADNSSGWNIASEKGDKFDAAWSGDGTRVTYSRLHEGVTRVIERGTSTATSEPIDPGDGTARWPQFLPDKRVLYVYESPSVSAAIYIQEPKPDAERTRIDVSAPWTAPESVTTPTYQVMTIGDITSGAMVYRWSEQSGPIPAVIVLRDRPQTAQSARFDILEQALSAEGFVIVVPTRPGSPGEGKKLASGLAERIEFEGDFDDLVAIIDAVREIPGVDTGRVALVGVGQGGAAALTLAGSRPGLVTAIAAIDPVADWNAEFDAADAETRAWIQDTIGLPASNQGRFAVRTPATFAGIIDIPVLLMGTESAPAGRSAQLDGLANLLRDLDRPFTHDVSIGESEWDAMRRVAGFVRESLLAVPAQKVETAEAVTADAV